MHGNLFAWLVKHALIHRSLGVDYQVIETLQIETGDWHFLAVILYVYCYNCLRFQCAYDVAPDGLLASVTRIEYVVDFFLNGKERLSTTVTPSVVAKVDYSTAASPLALPDAWKPDLHPPKDTPVE
ncbi:hypothetical protein Hdeb2414_s0009g00327901 [Helianthus debilis subsp. tardiflorus]